MYVYLLRVKAKNTCFIDVYLFPWSNNDIFGYFKFRGVRAIGSRAVGGDLGLPKTIPAYKISFVF